MRGMIMRHIDLLIFNGGVIDLSDNKGRRLRRAVWVFVAAAIAGTIALVVF